MEIHIHTHHKATKEKFSALEIEMNCPFEMQRWTRGVVLLGVALCSILTVRAQDAKPEEIVAFACGFTGEPSNAVVRITRLLQTRQYRKISHLLSTGTNAEKFLSVVSIERLAFKGRYQIDSSERKQIETIKTSEEKVSVCSGCTYFDEVSLSEMFKVVDYLGSDKWIAGIVK